MIPAGEPIADHLPPVLIRAAAQVVIEHDAHGGGAGELRQQALHRIDVVERGRPVVLRQRPARDPAKVAAPQPAPGRARKPEELAEFPVARPCAIRRHA